MSVSPQISSEMILTGIWTATLALLAASIIVLSILVVRRLIATRESEIAAKQKEKLSAIFMRALSLSAFPPVAAFREIALAPPSIVVDAALDVLRTISGEDGRRIAAVLKHWRIGEYAANSVSHGRRGLRIKALTLLSHFDDEESLAVIAGETDASDPYVQLAAIRALAERGAIDELPRIIRSLSGASNTNSVILADVLCRLGPQGSPAFLDLATSSAATPVRVAALRALIRVGSAPPIDIVERLLKDASPEIRAKAVTLLLKCETTGAEGALRQALLDPAPIVRIRAARAAGALSATSAAPLLVKAIEDKNWWVRYRAAEALAEINENGVQILKAIAKRGGPAAVIAGQVVAEREARNDQYR